MSFKISNAKLINKKVKPNKVTFTAENNKITSVISSDAKVLKSFKNLLEGKYLVETGLFKIDGYDKVNKQWTKRKVNVIAPSIFVRKWPEKFWLYISLLLNKSFYSQARINYIDQKYSYLSFTTSKNNKSDLKARSVVEEMISKFIDNAVEIEEKWLNEFLDQIVKFNDSNLDKQYGELEEHIRIIVKDYYYLIEKTLNLSLLETFLQSLWDKVYSFIELQSLCTCEYNAKTSKDKEIKKLAKDLNFHQLNFIVRKQLKIIDVKVSLVRRKIYKNKFIIKNLEKQIFFELSKLNNKKRKIRNLDDYFKWRQLSKDQRTEFISKQEKMFFEGLPDEATILRGKIVEVMHQYHNELLNGLTTQGNEQDFKNKKKELLKSIQPISKQAMDFVDGTTKQLGFNFDLVTIKWTTINQIYFEILRSIYLKKYNIVFYNVLKTLSKEDKVELHKVINNLFNLDKKFTIVFLEDDLSQLLDLNSNVYLIDEESIKEKSIENILKESWNTYANSIFYNKNRVAYYYDGKYLKVNDEKIKLINSDFKEKGQILIDPFKIFDSKKSLKGHVIEISGIVNPTDKLSDPNMYEFVSKKGLRLVFYSLKTYNKNEYIKLYIDENSILKIL